MKKTLLIGALVLMIVTSMVAGTLAVYSNTTMMQANAAAMRFYIGATETKSADLKLAPGESDTYEFVATNVNPEGNVVTEVPMSLTIATQIPEGFGDDIVIDLDGIEYDSKSTNEDGTVVTFTVNRWSEAGVSTTENATLTYKWVDDGNYEEQTSRNNVTDTFYVSVTGTQINSAE